MRMSHDNGNVLILEFIDREGHQLCIVDEPYVHLNKGDFVVLLGKLYKVYGATFYMDDSHGAYVSVVYVDEESYADNGIPKGVFEK